VNPFLAIIVIHIIRKLINSGREELMNKTLGKSISSLSLAILPISVDAKNINVIADENDSNIKAIEVLVSCFPSKDVSNTINTNIGKDIEYGHKGGDRFLI
tara:strand:+ start:1283 stop:1585 length:303 start_codon:yes stop_codon:yes gene_type:complete